VPRDELLASLALGGRRLVHQIGRTWEFHISDSKSMLVAPSALPWWLGQVGSSSRFIEIKYLQALSKFKGKLIGLGEFFFLRVGQ
jgi:hypothetical protein